LSQQLNRMILAGEIDEPSWCTRLEASTCWDFPYQSPDGSVFGSNRYKGCTPAMAVWNLLRRYTRPGDLVVDCMAGGGTTIDVARALGRRVIGLDLKPSRPDIVRNDARHLPFEDDSVDFHFVDSPYSDNLRYSSDGRCIGKIPANTERFFEEIAKVAAEIHRTLKLGKYAAWIISDEYRRRRYTPVGFKVYGILVGLFEPVDTVVLVRHHDSGANPMWEHKARERNFFLRGFKYLFIMRKMAVEG
jgi:hypothetical protein